MKSSAHAKTRERIASYHDLPPKSTWADITRAQVARETRNRKRALGMDESASDTEVTVALLQAHIAKTSALRLAQAETVAA